MKKRTWIILSLFLLVVLVFLVVAKLSPPPPCQTEPPQTPQEVATEAEKYFQPFMILHNENGERMLDYEEAFIQNVEKIKRENLQRGVITEQIADVVEQKKLLSEIEEIQFYELSTGEKISILDTSNVNPLYRFWGDLRVLSTKKLYRFWEFQLAICWGAFVVWISCVNDFSAPFQIVERDDENIFTGVLIRKVGDSQRHSLLTPQIGNFPVSMRVQNGRLFLIVRIMPGEESPSMHDWYGAVYTLEKVRWDEAEWYGRIFHQCYDTAYKTVGLQYAFWEDSLLPGSILWDDWLFMEDMLVSPGNCFGER